MPVKPKSTRSSREAKRALIAEAALAEFIARGFQAASTNAIATRAGVAKGLVFHYFGNKDALYLEVLEWVAGEFQRVIRAGLDPAPPTDLFARLHHYTAVKLQVMREHPAFYRFLLQAASQSPKHLQEAIQQRLAATTASGWQTFVDGLDFSKLRPGITPEKAIQVLVMLREGMERSFLQRILAAGTDEREIAKLSDEALENFELLRDGIYRRE